MVCQLCLSYNIYGYTLIFNFISTLKMLSNHERKIRKSKILKFKYCLKVSIITFCFIGHYFSIHINKSSKFVKKHYYTRSL